MNLPKIITNLEIELIKVFNITHNVKHLVFSTNLDTDFNFLPGQFITLFLVSNEGKRVNRAYSIATKMTSANIELCIKILEDGEGTQIIDKLSVGDKLRAIGPSGRFVLSEDISRDITFIATGTGLAPFRPMINFLINSNFKNKINLYFTVSYKKDLFYIDEFLELAKINNNFNFHYSISRPSKDDIDLNHGRVTSLIDSLHNDFNGDFYICGLTDMIEDVQKLLCNKGVDINNIHFERYD